MNFLCVFDSLLDVIKHDNNCLYQKKKNFWWVTYTYAYSKKRKTSEKQKWEWVLRGTEQYFFWECENHAIRVRIVEVCVGRDLWKSSYPIFFWKQTFRLGCLGSCQAESSVSCIVSQKWNILLCWNCMLELNCIIGEKYISKYDFLQDCVLYDIKHWKTLSMCGQLTLAGHQVPTKPLYPSPPQQDKEGKK